ncbi:peptide chain release factor 2 [Candidatus Methylopumilus planktonicus]|uniref:peptide chain release factor 2 n=1 Tax=Candidatus Methylopumilus planktonicus TaxID=1581557 RepID=UPI0011214655|nr:peptide chain release factor 2 [Candidatus Methylopumilus planktonicus]QDD00582.1 peptide chain release factor 2 [Candidatus Methylopumilus planktonicus]
MDAETLNQIQHRLDGLNERHQALRGYLDFDVKKSRLDQISKELEDPSIWNDQARSQILGKEKRELDFIVNGLSNLAMSLKDQCELFELARNENDDETLKVVLNESQTLEKSVEAMEFRRMFSHPMDPNNCFINFQSGSGGTEAQDWANMLLRMYIRYGERKGFKVEVLDISDGDIAGIKSATLKISGDYAFGHLRTETGVHRLVRKSPFDSGNRRHTSFASVQVYPEVDDSIEVDINPADLRIDTYRASGAGGQHINKTDSAVRITHIPTNTVVQCQDDRSQHRNRAEAMNMLRAQLYALELNKRNEEKQALEDAKTDIGWGHQIRSYVLDQSRIKDLRTNVEVGNTQGVLDGDLDPFISESLKQGV